MMASGSYSGLVVVAGSGERVISLLNHNSLERVDIVDPNPEALYLTEIKITALSMFSATEYLFFTGFYSKSENLTGRKEMLPLVLEALSERCAEYWAENQEIIISGRLLRCGHFETFLGKVHAIIRLLFADTPTVLRAPYREWKRYDRWVWNVLKEIFKYKLPYRLMGNRDPAFIHKDADLSIIANALQKSFDENEQFNSFFVHLLFRGNMREMPKSALPASLSEGFLTDLKKRLNPNGLEIKYYRSDLRSYLKEKQGFANTFISSSDLLSFELPEYMNDIFALLRAKNQKGPNQVVWRSFLKHREFEFGLSDAADGPIEDISRFDQTHMYNVYSLKVSP